MSSSIKDLYDYELIKQCSKCKSICPKSNFHKDKSNPKGYKNICKNCCKTYDKTHYIENRERRLTNQKKYNDENSETLKEYQVEYRKNNREKLNKYQKVKRETEPNYKLACNLRNRTSNAFKSQNVTKRNKTFDLLGCSIPFFKSWIEFQLYGDMTMENYGKIWQIDHTVAVSSFNLLDETEMKKCFNWRNLRPMYSKDNMSKGNKIDMRLYLLQDVKANYFLKSNDQEERHN